MNAVSIEAATEEDKMLQRDDTIRTHGIPKGVRGWWTEGFEPREIYLDQLRFGRYGQQAARKHYQEQLDKITAAW